MFSSYLMYLLWFTTFSLENESDSSGEEDMSIEVISPPRRPITRSVSANRAADEIEPEDNNTPLISSSPRPRKIRRITRAPGMFTDHFQWLVADPLPESSSKTPLFERSQTPESIKAGGFSDTTSVNAPFCLDKDYFESENPWEEEIAYF